MFAALDRLSGSEQRTRSDIVREALRQYVSGRPLHLPPAEEATPEEAAAINRGREEYKQGKTVRLQDMRRELGLSTQ